MSKANTDFVKGRFFHYLNTIHPMSREDFAMLEDTLELRRVSKRMILASEEQNASSLYFVCAGLIRQFYASESGKEINKGFSFENQVLLSQPSGSASDTSVILEALEDSLVLCAPMEKIWQLCTTNLAWSNLVRILVQHEANKIEDREAQLLLDSAEVRYVNFVHAHQSYLDRIPNYHIASYIGITQEALSRIKKRIVARADGVENVKHNSRYDNVGVSLLAGASA